MTDLNGIRALDRSDPLAACREQFHLPADMIYLDGNSLGAMPKSVRSRMETVVGDEWGEALIGSWGARWFDLPVLVGNQIAPLIGATEGEVVVGDSTSVNLFKLLSAALTLRPGRKTILTEVDNFPTDNYIVQGLARQIGDIEIRYAPIDADLRQMFDDSVAAVLLTHVNYRTAAIHDMTAITRAAHDAGALAIWDLSHTTGAMPVDLDASDVDLAVGCTYKYLNGGPGAPAFSYVAQRLCRRIVQPLSGWMGHDAPFDFAMNYEPARSIRRFICGTPQILSLSALSDALMVFADVDMRAVRDKSMRMTSLFIHLIDVECADFDIRVVSPRTAERRGSHVSLSCPDGYPIMRALAERGVVGDFRAPDLMRFGFAPLYCSYEDVYRAALILRDVMRSGEWRADRFSQKQIVT